jgi:hypothetical protein
LLPPEYWYANVLDIAAIRNLAKNAVDFAFLKLKKVPVQCKRFEYTL